MHIRRLVLVSLLTQIFRADLDITTKLVASVFFLGSVEVPCQLLVRMSYACKALYRSNELYELHKG